MATTGVSNGDAVTRPTSVPSTPPRPPASAYQDHKSEPAAQPASALAGESDEHLDEEATSSRFILFNALPSSIISGVLHFIVFLVLALWYVEPPPKKETLALSAGATKQEDEISLEDEHPELRLDAVADSRDDAVQNVLREVVAEAEAPTVAVDVDATPIQIDVPDFGEETAPKGDLMATVGALAGAGLSGRGTDERAKLAAQIGGTTESEAAVALALKWFEAHQNKDGSWNFDHRAGQCKGRCSDPGLYSECRTGATAMALLPFLGAGQTHQEGQYKEVVERGLYFLTSQMKTREQGGMKTGDMTQGVANDRGYSHALAAITLCEAYAMTHDRKLMGPAQLSLNYIAYAQDPVGGGWRYSPKMPGDTSVVGWQLMALKSGHMAYLTVPPGTIQGAIRFLDSTAALGGTRYGYTGPGQGDGTTAVGLLCRMYTGWRQDNPALREGVVYLASRQARMRDNMYFNYYATQVLRQYCGDPDSEGHEMWDKWNATMRDWLVREQDKTGHQAGSWFMRGDHGSEKGGRLYCTSMATMILEVYYRHMPIYGKAAATEDFPL
jgi:hypothetical protein